jgi:hypothetical protein
MSKDLITFDVVGDEGDQHEFMELIAEYFHKDPFELEMGDYITRLVSSTATVKNKPKCTLGLCQLISEEYTIDMEPEDLYDVKTLGELWKFINESMVEDEFTGAEDMEE